VACSAPIRGYYLLAPGRRTEGLPTAPHPQLPRALKNIGFVNFIFKGIRNPPVSNQVLVDFLNSV